MTTLITMRAVVRRNLHDEDATAYLWTDNEIDRHLAHAVTEFSLALPLETRADVATVAGGRDLDITALTGRISIAAVEFPKGYLPPRYNRFGVWLDTLTLLDEAVGTGANAAVYYGKLHTLSASASTIPACFEELVARGAGGYAALELAVFTANRVNHGGADTAARYLRLGTYWVKDFKAELRRVGHRGGVRTSSFYGPAALPVSERRVYGP